MFELKPLSLAAVPSALSKAERYRLLNEPGQSQSICDDVLRADPGNHEALVMLILALSDDFPRQQGQTAARARELVDQLPTEYERAYYGGLIAERRARALVDRGGDRRGVQGLELDHPLCPDGRSLRPKRKNRRSGS